MPLAWLYAGLLVYASLYPFVPWRLTGVAPYAFLLLPWPRYWTGFDLVANLFGYLPFGGLVFGAIVRGGGRLVPALILACAAGSALSLAMETLQNFLPQRVASNLDLGLNAFGTALGAALGAWLQSLGMVERWQAARDRWFIGRSRGAIALMLLWPVGLLFPLPVPFGQGQVFDELQLGIGELLAGTPLGAALVDPPVARPALPPGVELASIALGLLGPCLVGFCVSRSGWRRLLLVFGAAALGCATTTLSTALAFAPQHAAAWATPRALAAVGCAIVVAGALAWLPRRVAAGLGLVALTALVMLVTRAPADPFFAQSLKTWEQGRFIRFYGAARWIGWLWPYAAMLYLLARVGAREPDF